MECPVCGTESKLFAETKPNGRIGCFCRKCGKGYVTRDPEKGWDESKFCLSKIDSEDISYMKQRHGVDLMKELCQIIEVEFEKFIRGDLE